MRFMKLILKNVAKNYLFEIYIKMFETYLQLTVYRSIKKQFKFIENEEKFVYWITDILTNFWRCSLFTGYRQDMT